MTTPTPAETTTGRRPRDMVLSMLVLLVPIALVVLLFQYLGQDTEVNVVDPGESVAAAQRAGLDVTQPRLPDGWKSTSAVTRTGDGAVTLRIGYVTPSGGFAQLVVSDADAEPLLKQELGGGAPPRGEERIDDATWLRYPGRGEETALVLTEPTRTIVVLGTAPLDELRTLAAASG